MERGNGVSVERLTARLTGRTAPAVDERQARRVWLSTLLAGCDLAPPAMPPSALLVVRKLADPLPGQIAKSRHAVRPEPEWEQAVRGVLSDLWRRAPRPGRGAGGGFAGAAAVPEAAEAVFFLDAAEQTACLAVDLAEGRAAARWWWRKLLPPGGSAAGGLFLVLSRRPDLLPAVFSYLAAWGKAQAVVTALSPAEGLLLALGVSAAYGLPDWRDVSFPILDADAVGRPALEADAPAPAADVPLTSPWAPPVAALLAGLGREQAVCLGLALTLADGLPSRAAALPQAEFLTALAAWWEEAGAVSLREDGPVASQAPRRAVDAASYPSAAARPTSASLGTGEAPPHANLTAAVAESAQLPVGALESGESPVVPWPLPVALEPEGVATRIGGVLYLINLMRRLDRFEAFPAEIGPWALLEALARALLPGGDPFAELAADPLWAALAALDGREPRTLPGDGLELPFPPGTEETADLSETLAADLNPALAAWLSRAVPHVVRHLQEALEVEEPVPHLLLVPGRLHVTATHVELTMDIERISVPVRMAGLDQDPGWQAPYRRVILFHFV